MPGKFSRRISEDAGDESQRSIPIRLGRWWPMARRSEEGVGFKHLREEAPQNVFLAPHFLPRERLSKAPEVRTSRGLLGQGFRATGVRAALKATCYFSTRLSLVSCQS